MTAGRETVLARLRAAQRTARVPNVEAGRPLPNVRERTVDECLDRLGQELVALGVETHAAASAEEVRARIAAHLDGRKVLSWDPALLPYQLGSVVGSPVLGSHRREDQASAEIGLTGCDGAIAETGTLALLSGPGRSRAVSLLPPVHLAVLRRGDVVFTMQEFLRAHAKALEGAACCTFITGPSRTADIELTLTLGVHGPGRVVVIIGP
jgi:L-lactate dehydrogenase complex protein LldG